MESLEVSISGRVGHIDFFFFSSRRRHTRLQGDWSSDVCSSDLQRTLDFLARQGIEAERVEFVSRKPRPEYLTMYGQMDIGLDTFPYNGHTTSLEIGRASCRERV